MLRVWRTWTYSRMAYWKQRIVHRSPLSLRWCNGKEICRTMGTKKLKNTVFWDVTPCGFCKTRSFRGSIATIIRATRMGELGTTLAVTSNRLLMLFLAHRVLLHWCWRYYITPKLQSLQEPCGVTFQKTVFLLVAVKTPNLTWKDWFLLSENTGTSVVRWLKSSLPSSLWRLWSIHQLLWACRHPTFPVSTTVQRFVNTEEFPAKTTRTPTEV
jgi:hypothetical protein